MNEKPIAVLGATGYVGGRLVPQLLNSGYRVRALARSFAKMHCRSWAEHPMVELFECDALDSDSVKAALAGCHAAFHLLHSMKIGNEEAALIAAHSIATAASDQGLQRIIYLGRLENEGGAATSGHLKTSIKIAEIFQSKGVPVTTLRAALILGSGSASFEILRYLADRLPVIFAPRWFRTAVQPISIRNVLGYLVGCLRADGVQGQTFDIGGPDLLTFQDLTEIYVEEAGLSRRIIIPIPATAPRLSSYWVHLVTPVPGATSRSLIESMKASMICKDSRIVSILPQPLLSCREAIRIALDRVQQQLVETCWSDAGILLPPEWSYSGDDQFGGGTVLNCGYRVNLEAAPGEVWKPLVESRGQLGIYADGCLWSLRSWLGRLIGGTGLQAGCRHPSKIFIGDALGSWRVVKIEPCRHLTLLSKMKIPGEAVLDFKINKLQNGQTELVQLLRFLPKGLWGIFYWYSLFLFHQWIFRRMLNALAKAVGKPISFGPERFAAKFSGKCPISSNSD